MLTSGIGSRRAFFFLYTRYPIAAPSNAMPATPPTTPPAMAPVFDLPVGLGLGVLDVDELAGERLRLGLVGEVPPALDLATVELVVIAGIDDEVGRLAGALDEELPPPGWEEEGFAGALLDTVYP